MLPFYIRSLISLGLNLGARVKSETLCLKITFTKGKKNPPFLGGGRVGFQPSFYPSHGDFWSRGRLTGICCHGNDLC